LNSAGIRPALLKGAAILTLGYAQFGDRPMGDVDLWIPPADLSCASQALETAGFHQDEPPSAELHPFMAELTGELRFHGKKDTLIELHWHLICAEWLRLLLHLDEAEIWSRTQPCTLGAASVCCLSPEDNLLHLCFHLAFHHFVHPQGFHDIQRLLAQNPAFAWDTFLQRAAAYRLRPACYFALSTAAHSLGAPVPTEVLDRLRPGFFRRRLVRSIADPYQALAGRLIPSNERGYLLHLAIAERPWDVLRLLAWLFFPGPSWLRQRYRLSGLVSSLFACLWHPVLVLGKGLQGLKTVIEG